MKLVYDPATDSLYIELAERPGVDVVEIADGVVLDVGDDGAPVGIDIQHASTRVDLTRIDAVGVPTRS